jgi:hypothetical protein
MESPEEEPQEEERPEELSPEEVNQIVTLPQNEWDWLTFLSTWHSTEYERRYTLENVVTTPITLLTGAFGLQYLLTTQFDFESSGSLLTWFFVLPVATSFALCIYSSFYVYKSYAVLKNGVYKGIPDPKGLIFHMGGLVKHYRKHEPSSDGIQKFKEYFVKLLADQITVNVINNDDRTENIQKSKKPVMYALLALLFSLPCSLISQRNKPDQTYKVTLVRAKLAMTDSTISQLPTMENQQGAKLPLAADSSETSKPGSKPPPPPPPRERSIKEEIDWGKTHVKIEPKPPKP